MKKLGLSLISALTAAHLFADPCSKPMQIYQQSAYALTTEPSQIPIGQPFQVLITRCDTESSSTSTSITAWMPDHNHGMNYTPRLRSKQGDVHIYEGFLFHMPGRWEFELDIKIADQRTTLRWEREITP